jgi:hypothetical protein
MSLSDELGERIMSTITNTPLEADREREAERARADLLRRAEAQGIKPFASLEDFAGDPALTADFDVDAFLRQVREDRDRPSGRSID